MEPIIAANVLVIQVKTLFVCACVCGVVVVVGGDIYNGEPVGPRGTIITNRFVDRVRSLRSD